MPELPSGTVTLLFSDIEGSTALVRDLGEGWADVLRRQRELCRRAWVTHAGYELGTEGDSFFVAFSSAEEAVAAAVQAQCALGAEPWPSGAAIKVRIGIHTGTPMRHEEGYVGLDVHRAARIAAAAHGGQIVVSEFTAALLPGPTTLLDLGLHVLKDIPHRLRLHQVAGPDLVRDFPPLRTQGGAGSLPTLLTPTVGRDGELAELRALLCDERARLVTLTGPGGTGKTRLSTAVAAEVANEYDDGVFFVALDSARRGDEVWPAIARVLDLPAEGQAPPGFFTHLGRRRVLLILDNLEQIPDADAIVRELLTSAPGVSVVATSRRPLHVSGEYDHAVPPLDLPSGTTEPSALRSGAVQMFVDHAARAKRGFELSAENAADVATLVTRLDGLPLAIELAAARAKLFSPGAILARIDKALDVAATDRSREDRQRTLRGAIDWSYQLLDPPHRAVLDHLGVFEGGADVEAVEVVVPDDATGDHDVVDLLFDLVDASLVRAEDDGSSDPRFALLETVKSFARDRLTRSGRWEEARRSHAGLFYRRATTTWAEQRATGPPSARELVTDLDNLHAVVDRVPTGLTDPEWYAEEVPPLHVVALLASLTCAAGRFHTVLQWTRTAEAWSAHADPVGLNAARSLRAQALQHTGELGPALELMRTVTHHHRQGSARLPPWVDPSAVALDALNREVWCLTELGRVDEAAAPLARIEALQPPAEQAWQVSEARYTVAYYQGDFEAAHAHLLQSSHERPTPGGLREANCFADLDLQLGRLREGQARLAAVAPEIDSADNPYLVIVLAATYAAIIGQQHPLLCARVYGSYERTRIVEALPDTPAGEEEDERVLSRVRPLVSPEAWDAAWAEGRTETLQDLIREMAALPPLPED